MATEVYGRSDDLVEFDGDVDGEIGCFGTDDNSHGVLVVFSDGTVLDVKYGKLDLGIWGIAVLRWGHLLDRVDECVDEGAVPYSDMAHFKSGLRWARAATEWQRVN